MCSIFICFLELEMPRMVWPDIGNLLILKQFYAEAAELDLCFSNDFTSDNPDNLLHGIIIDFFET